MKTLQNNVDLYEAAQTFQNVEVPAFFSAMRDPRHGQNLMTIGGVEFIHVSTLKALLEYLERDEFPDPVGFVPPFLREPDLRNVDSGHFLRGVLKNVEVRDGEATNLGPVLNLGGHNLAQLLMNQGAWNWFHDSNEPQVEGVSCSVIDGSQLRVGHVFSVRHLMGVTNGFVSASYSVDGTALSPRTSLLMIKPEKAKVVACHKHVDKSCAFMYMA